MRCDFALLHGDVNDFMKACAIAYGVNMRNASLHPIVTNNAAAFDFDAGLLQTKRTGIRLPTKGEKNLFGGNTQSLSVFLKCNLLQSINTIGFAQMRPAVDGDSFTAKN